MGFTEDIAKVSEHVRNHADKAVGEQATKMALIVPFLSALGYDVYDPNEFKPEYVADFAIKKAGQFEKVDYALAINGNIVMIVEAKAHRQKPETHDGQLSRYFNALVTTKVAIVANGIEYRFFTDLRQTNVMDKEPFFAFNILEYDAKDIDNLKLFHRDIFEAIAITSHAEEMVYLKGMTHLVGNLLRSPSDQFVRFLVSELRASDPRYELQGNINAKVIEKFKSIVKKSLQGSLLELMTRSLSQEMAQSTEAGNVSQANEVEANDATEEPETAEESKIVTTAEELDAFEKIKAILKTSHNYKYEIQYKDTVSYFGINLGKTTWWFLRLYLSSSKKSFVARLGIDEVKSLALDFPVQEVPASFGETTSKVSISSVNDLDKLASLIRRCYEVEADRH